MITITHNSEHATKYQTEIDAKLVVNNYNKFFPEYFPIRIRYAVQLLQDGFYAIALVCDEQTIAFIINTRN